MWWTIDMNKHILAFRTFDFRVRFPMPFETFAQALEALQSSRACSQNVLVFNVVDHAIERVGFDVLSNTTDEYFLTKSYEKVVNIFGRFNQETIDFCLS